MAYGFARSIPCTATPLNRLDTAEVTGSIPVAPTVGTPCAGGCRMDWAAGRGSFACLGEGASIVVSGSGRCERSPVDLEQVVDGADESPLARRGVESSARESPEPVVGFDVPEDCLDGGFAFSVSNGSVFGSETVNHGSADFDRVGTAAAVVLEQFACRGR